MIEWKDINSYKIIIFGCRKIYGRENNDLSNILSRCCLKLCDFLEIGVVRVVWGEGCRSGKVSNSG